MLYLPVITATRRIERSGLLKIFNSKTAAFPTNVGLSKGKSSSSIWSSAKKVALSAHDRYGHTREARRSAANVSCWRGVVAAAAGAVPGRAGELGARATGEPPLIARCWGVLPAG